MELPFFYIGEYEPNAGEIVLDEDNSKHVVQVLRMAVGERLQLTDGRGLLLDGTIVDAHKKKCRVKVDAIKEIPARANPVTIGISLVKNASRFEWFLEKAAEMGVAAVVPLLCERTERQHFRLDRMRQILVSAMLQSQQCWLPALPEPQGFEVVAQGGGILQHASGKGDSTGGGGFAGLKFIAHCVEEERTSLAQLVGRHRMTAEGMGASLILIGPEGDFSPKEIGVALENGFMPVMLGETRLRTETAGVVATALLCIH